MLKEEKISPIPSILPWHYKICVQSKTNFYKLYGSPIPEVTFTMPRNDALTPMSSLLALRKSSRFVFRLKYYSKG